MVRALFYRFAFSTEIRLTKGKMLPTALIFITERISARLIIRDLFSWWTYVRTYLSFTLRNVAVTSRRNVVNQRSNVIIIAREEGGAWGRISLNAPQRHRWERVPGNGGDGWSGVFSHGGGEGCCRAFSHGGGEWQCTAFTHGYRGWVLRAN